jgi:DNA-binding IclR family transcriptional regulator
MTDSDGTGAARASRGVETGLRILELLGGWEGPATLPRPAPAELHDIAAALAVPEPTAHRILQALLRAGWVEKVGSEYRLAFKVGLIGVGIHEVLRRQAESCMAMIEAMDQVGSSLGHP